MLVCVRLCHAMFVLGDAMWFQINEICTTLFSAISFSRICWL